jgi:hypothetical protein
MSDPVSGIPAQRGPSDPTSAAGGAPIPLAEVLTWHRPGVHRVRLADREVWVRMDGRGIASISSIGPERLACPPLD